MINFLWIIFSLVAVVLLWKVFIRNNLPIIIFSWSVIISTYTRLLVVCYLLGAKGVKLTLIILVGLVIVGITTILLEVVRLAFKVEE